MKESALPLPSLRHFRMEKFSDSLMERVLDIIFGTTKSSLLKWTVFLSQPLALSFITYLIILTRYEPFYFLYFLPITGAAFYGGVGGGFLSVLGAVFFDSLAQITYFKGKALFNQGLTRFLLWGLVAIQVGWLSEQLKKSKDILGKREREKSFIIKGLETLREVDKMVMEGNEEREILNNLPSLLKRVMNFDLVQLSFFSLEEGILVTHEIWSGLPLEVVSDLGPAHSPSAWSFLNEEPLFHSNIFQINRFEKLSKKIHENLGLKKLSSFSFPFHLNTSTYVLTCYLSDEEMLYSQISFLKNLFSQVVATLGSVKNIERIRRLPMEILKSLAVSLDAVDPYTRGHSMRVAEISKKIALRLGLSEGEVEEVEKAALIHDVGKIAVPGLIFKKPTPLSLEEIHQVKMHPYYSAQIIKPIEFLQSLIPSVYHHHERFDGNGYPDGLKGEDIPLGARIIAVADAWDAMTSERPYRRALDPLGALNELKVNSGTQFDPKIVQVFCKLLEEGGV